MICKLPLILEAIQAGWAVVLLRARIVVSLEELAPDHEGEVVDVCCLNHQLLLELGGLDLNLISMILTGLDGLEKFI